MGYLKEYIDRGVQTCSPSRRPSEIDGAVVLIATGSNCAHHSPNSIDYETGEARSFHSSQDNSAYSQSLLPNSPRGPIKTAVISRRGPKRKQLPYSRPSQTRGEEPRTVSMPEVYSPRPLLDSPALRVVSMPGHMHHSDWPSDTMQRQSSTSTISSYVASGRMRGRARAYPPPSDVPYTPSPPSSPDSVVIIENNMQLPSSFLCQKYSPEPLNSDDDEDWVTWASSPPRPIPALHGPLSLPYARCPSGAEGTIIEEPDNMSRMIWGLEPDDPRSSQLRGSSHASTHENTQNHRTTAPTHPPHVPFRTQKKQMNSHSQAKVATSSSEGPAPDGRYQKTPSHMAASLGTRQQSGHRSSTSSYEDSTRSNPTREGVSLKYMYDNQGAVGKDYTDDEARVPSTNQNILFEWQMALAAQQARRTTVVESDYPPGYGVTIQQTATFSPSRSTQFPQTYPRIFVEPRPNDTMHTAIPPRRQSAIEIAQQYQKKQLQQKVRQHQSFLPTPPNSSSPQWSSNFSPYQGSLLSPDFTLSISKTPILANNSTVPYQRQRPGSGNDTSQQLRRFVHERMGNAALNSIQETISPQVHQDIAVSPNRQHNASVPSTFAKYMHHLEYLSPTVSVHSPPLPPGPPPNTPLPSVPAVTTPIRINPAQQQSKLSTSVTDTPPSPVSPEARSRSISYQHPRSVPLARLVQRRLSSVPEEDLNSYLDRSHALSPSSVKQQQATERTPLTGQSLQGVNRSPVRKDQQGSYLLAPQALYRSRTPSPDPPTLSTLSREYMAQPSPGNAKAWLNPQAQVRLPYARDEIEQTRVLQGNEYIPQAAGFDNYRLDEVAVPLQPSARDASSRKRTRGRKSRPTYTSGRGSMRNQQHGPPVPA